MPINVSEALDSDTAIFTVVERKGQGGYVDGVYVKAEDQILKVLLSPQQPSPEEAMVLPEGERNKDMFKFICNKLLRPTIDKDNIQADRVKHEGNWYKIIRVEGWIVFGHCIAYGVRD